MNKPTDALPLQPEVVFADYRTNITARIDDPAEAKAASVTTYTVQMLIQVDEAGKLMSANIVSGKAPFDAILANIERNTLIDAMPALHDALVPGGILLLSGFIADDLPAMRNAAAKHGLEPEGSDKEGEWTLLKCRKTNVSA